MGDVAGCGCNEDGLARAVARRRALRCYFLPERINLDIRQYASK